jgi:phage regulator Rha-like protein
MPATKAISIPDERIVKRILVIRGKKVMLDRDLAELYGVETKTLVRSVKRNVKRFPEEFMFQLTKEEFDSLRYQFGTSNQNQRGGRRYQPYAFTEHGTSMLSSVLRSDRAIQINILIIKAFVRMRELLETNEVLRAKLNAMEQQLGTHSKQIRDVYSVLRRLIEEPVKPKNTIGFGSPKAGSGKS